MASVASLGIHTPSAIPYLIAEGILPQDASETLYTWRTIPHTDNIDYGDDEEIFFTGFTVVWSRAGVVQRVFNLEIEGEPISHAVLAYFPASKSIHDSLQPGSMPGLGSKVQPPTYELDDSRKRNRESNGTLQQREAASPLKKRHQDATAFPAVNEDFGRALFVTLKTQAHVYFLSGTSHIVNLPFEVASIFPLEYGVILQRKIEPNPTLQHTPNLPSAPFNSFVHSHPSSSDTLPSSQTLRDLASGQQPNQGTEYLFPLFKAMISQTSSKYNEDLPTHVYFTDPLTEMGLVTEAAAPNTSFQQNSRIKPLTSLDAGEDLLYISTKDELNDTRSAELKTMPVLIALTRNRGAGQDSLWKVSYSTIKKEGKSANSTISRRRSSHPAGHLTGTVTPAVRSSVGLRESLGGAKDPSESTAAQQEIDLALQLDLENPGQASSRRISSVVARSDLSTNRDRSSYIDLVGVNIAGGARRGPSFGTQGAGSSFGLNLGLASKSRRNFSSSDTHSDTDRARIVSNSIHDASDNDDDPTTTSFSSMHERINSLRNERKQLVFTKIHHFPIFGHVSQPLSVPPETYQRPQVFTLSPPSIPETALKKEIMMYIMDRNIQRLSVINFEIDIQSWSKKKGLRKTGTGHQQIIRFLDHRGAEDVHGASRISQGACSRLLVLRKSHDGFGELLLQAPWTTLFTVQLPSNLMVHNLYHIGHGGSTLRKREGGLKRVISQGPGAMIDLQHGNGHDQVDVVDQDGTRHRLEIRLIPENRLVDRLIKVAEFVSPTEESESEPFTRAWWDVLKWLRDQPEEVVELEWTAFVIVLFSMTLPLMDHRQRQSVFKQKKRKGGLSRTSSGTQIDLDGWNAMMAWEARLSGSSPNWMKSSAWSWVKDLEVNSFIPSSQNRGKLARDSNSNKTVSIPMIQKSNFLLDCMSLAREFAKSPAGISALGEQGYLPTAVSSDPGIRRVVLPSILTGLHLFREELKLNVLAANEVQKLAPILAQIGGWLDWDSWGWRGSSFYMLENEDMEKWNFDDSVLAYQHRQRPTSEPPSILSYVEQIETESASSEFITLLNINCPSTLHKKGTLMFDKLTQLTPRTVLILQLLQSNREDAAKFVMDMIDYGLNIITLDTLPEGIAAPLRAAMAVCQAHPAGNWPAPMLALIDRSDVSTIEQHGEINQAQVRPPTVLSHVATRDFSSICNSALENDGANAYEKTAGSDRQAVSSMIFHSDQRFGDAAKLLDPLTPSIASCIPEPDWSDTTLLEAQQELVKIIAVRTLSVSPGRGMLFYSARYPLLTERFPIHAFTLSCVMKPANTTVTADRSSYTEDKVAWAFFHAGVGAGLTIAKGAKGIDTSWILFNKPSELNNRHAGFLLALGLNGHLKSIAKWVAFKYLTPKHTMTSIGLLLGLATTYLGTMNTLVIRLLSIHVTRMLPPDSANLNLDPLAQTTGIMATGLLYCNTQHRRMSEIMLSEMESTYQDPAKSPMKNLRDEGYRLAAGLALGFINLGQGRNMKGLHDMRMVERLLALAVGIRKVETVHILDKATAGATVAVALVYMKTHDEAVARKIDIPDTVQQFEYVRPDIFFLRTVAHHLIMWDNIRPAHAWMRSKLPLSYQPQAKLHTIRTLSTEDMPLFNIVAGLCFSIGLRFAGTARKEVRDLLGHYLDQFIRICRLPTITYDAKVTRITVRNCQDATALALACVMAGTGDLYTFRRLRSLHGRSDPDTPYGSLLATHLAVGVLFLAGGTHSLGTSNLAVAALLTAFYPLFPTAIADNKFHLQAFRHLWVLAAQPRCLVVRDADSQQPVSIPVVIVLRSNAANPNLPTTPTAAAAAAPAATTTLEATAPCLLPDLDRIAAVHTNSPAHWHVTLDLADNPAQRAAFDRHQSIYVRRRGPYDVHAPVFGRTYHALNATTATALSRLAPDPFPRWLFALPALRHFDPAERALVLPAPDDDADGNADAATAAAVSVRSTVVDDRLVLGRDCAAGGAGRAERLWNLRVLFAWADRVARQGGRLEWLGREVVEDLRAQLRLGIGGDGGVGGGGDEGMVERGGRLMDVEEMGMGMG